MNIPKQWDVVIYFCGTHASHIDKYVYLNSRLNKKLKTLMILDDGYWGVSSHQKTLLSKRWILNFSYSISLR